jgi:hypothetical protein
MPDLVERLLATIDAKARRAEAALRSTWTVAEWEKTMVVSNGPHMDGWVTYGGNDGFDGGVVNAATAAFIADNDPQTVLRRCAADRRMIERYLQASKTQSETSALLFQGRPASEHAALLHAQIEAGVAARTWVRAVRDLADGYGITDTEEAARG